MGRCGRLGDGCTVPARRRLGGILAGRSWVGGTVGGIAAVAKGADLMEVWWIASGRVGPGGAPRRVVGLYTLAGPGSASTTGGIAAVAKGGDLMEVWWVAPDGSVQAARTTTGRGDVHLAGPGSASTTGGIAAVAKGGDLTGGVVGRPDGSVQASYHDGGWNRYAPRRARRGRPD